MRNKEYSNKHKILSLFIININLFCQKSDRKILSTQPTLLQDINCEHIIFERFIKKFKLNFTK